MIFPEWEENRKFSKVSKNIVMTKFKKIETWEQKSRIYFYKIAGNANVS